MRLVWVTTEDHDEDWFFVASSSEEASKFHENMEGYEPVEANVKTIRISSLHSWQNIMMNENQMPDALHSKRIGTTELVFANLRYAFLDSSGLSVLFAVARI